MKLNLKKVKTGVFGIQGSGKTFLCETVLINQFRKPFVYLLHPEDFTKSSNAEIYIPYITINGKRIIDRSPEHLDKVMGWFIEKAKKGIYDAFFLDEASTFLPKDYRTLQQFPNIIDAVDNHRHYGTKKGEGFAFIYMARRPQTITTEITETSEYLIVFAIDGINVKDYFNKIHEDFKELMPKLSKNEHNFIVKELGEKPKLFNAVKVKSNLKELKGGDTLKNDNKRNTDSIKNN